MLENISSRLYEKCTLYIWQLIHPPNQLHYEIIIIMYSIFTWNSHNLFISSQKKNFDLIFFFLLRRRRWHVVMMLSDVDAACTAILLETVNLNNILCVACHAIHLSISSFDRPEKQRGKGDKVKILNNIFFKLLQTVLSSQYTFCKCCTSLTDGVGECVTLLGNSIKIFLLHFQSEKQFFICISKKRYVCKNYLRWYHFYPVMCHILL